jgi:hypothetical protein
MPGVRALLVKRGVHGFTAHLSRKKEVASRVRGVIKFPRLPRRGRVAVVARSAFFQCGVAPEQANAPDPHQARSHQRCACGRVIGGVRRMVE